MSAKKGHKQKNWLYFIHLPRSPVDGCAPNLAQLLRDVNSVGRKLPFATDKVSRR